jgi:hypothetical protein
MGRLRLGKVALMIVCALTPATNLALAQSLRYSSDEMHQPHQQHAHGQHSGIHRQGGIVEPSRTGPAPTGFWYRCDMPAGYYPYVPDCQRPWRVVPSAPAMPLR